jgi:hypothetical protein
VREKFLKGHLKKKGEEEKKKHEDVTEKGKEKEKKDLQLKYAVEFLKGWMQMMKEEPLVKEAR